MVAEGFSGAEAEDEVVEGGDVLVEGGGVGKMEGEGCKGFFLGGGELRFGEAAEVEVWVPGSPSDVGRFGRDGAGQREEELGATRWRRVTTLLRSQDGVKGVRRGAVWKAAMVWSLV